jgi:hypothetical protein
MELSIELDLGTGFVEVLPVHNFVGRNLINDGKEFNDTTDIHGEG